MFEVKGNDIYLTRGDTARLSVNITNICDDGKYTTAVPYAGLNYGSVDIFASANHMETL